MWLFRKSSLDNCAMRLQSIHEITEGDWSAEKILDWLDKAFDALNKVFRHYVLFYDSARRRQSWLSGLTRGGALILGTLGTLAPLLSGANPQIFQPYAPYGYPLLVAAAATLMANRLFSATGGHIRYVTAQFELERLMTQFQLDWANWKAKHRDLPLDQIPLDGAFDLFRQYTDRAYETIQSETNVWSRNVSDALDEYAKALASQKQSLSYRGGRSETP